MIEKGARTPRTLAAAFAQPIDRLQNAHKADPVRLAFEQLEARRGNFDRVYGGASSRIAMSVLDKAGPTLKDVAVFAAAPDGFSA